MIQRPTVNNLSAHEVPASVHEVLRSPGQPLGAETRALMEPRFGQDFSNVRVHADAKAAESARAVNALAYTVGRDVVFGAGRYQPGTNAGRSLMAHELTHVVQQRNLQNDAFSTLQLGPLDGVLEDQATAMAEGLSARAHTDRAVERLLQRAPVDRDERPRRQGSGTLSYREATELTECIRIMGEANSAYCRQEVLGERPPPPTHVSVPGITTPQPFGTQPRRDGSTNFDVNGVNVTFQPDVQSRDQSLANRAQTRINIRYGAINWLSHGGTITTFTGPGVPQATIRTTYGPGASSTGSSGYGRGTTAEDVRAGTTSIGFHEGRHGLDYLQYMAEHPFPQFTGARGMPTQDFRDAATAYQQAVRQYNDDLNDFSLQRTDCVGTTIDQSNAARGVVSQICRQQP